MLKIKRIYPIAIWLFVICLLIYSRFVNLGWGLPYPMHPDERNMAVAIQQLDCNLQPKTYNLQPCFNPHFFAYGQFPLYAAYLQILAQKALNGTLAVPISFNEAVISLRLISAIASILNFFVIFKIIKLLINKAINSEKETNSYSITQLLITSLLIIFSPFFIQFSHFGTTESLLMLLYSLVVYLSLRKIQNKILSTNYLLLTSLICGLAVATKLSSILFLAVPALVLIDKSFSKKHIFAIFKLIAFTLVFSIIFSPHNFISFADFLGSIRYESDVALGNYKAFYTRQFENTIPFLFQFNKIFPYVLGLPIFIFSLLGFALLSWKNKGINILRLAALIYFLPNAFFYAKWTRFVSPILPLLLLFAILFLNVILNLFQDLIMRFRIKSGMTKTFSRLTLCTLISALLLPGLAYLAIYQNPDVRFTASDWIYKNIPNNSYILSETANVVDIPFQTSNTQHLTSNYQYVSFDFYHLVENPDLQNQLSDHLAKAEYIFVPSRRLFKNNIEMYPALKEYYRKLYSGELGFQKVAEFSSYPTFKFQISNFKFQMELPDEDAEETWTVFDHPVIRIYKRTSS